MTVIAFPDCDTNRERRVRSVVEQGIAKRERRRQWSLFHTAKRRAAKLHRTPAWADMRAIWFIYLEAYRMTRTTGIEHHVDHFIPLQGELVSGLHVQENL